MPLPPWGVARRRAACLRRWTRRRRPRCPPASSSFGRRRRTRRGTPPTGGRRRGALAGQLRTRRRIAPVALQQLEKPFQAAVELLATEDQVVRAERLAGCQ